MEWLRFTSAVLLRSVADAWAFVMPGGLRELVRNGFIAAFGLVALYALDKQLVDLLGMSADNTRDTFIWFGLRLFVVAFGVFMLACIFNASVRVPFLLWKEKSDRPLSFQEDKIALGTNYQAVDVPGLDGPAVEWEDAGWAILAAAKRGPKPEFSTGHAKTLNHQIGWTLMLIKIMTDGGLLPLYAIYKNSRLGEKVWQGSDRVYHVDQDKRILFRFDHSGQPWDTPREVTDFEKVFVLKTDLEALLPKFEDGSIEFELDKIANHPTPDDGIDDEIKEA